MEDQADYSLPTKYLTVIHLNIHIYHKSNCTVKFFGQVLLLGIEDGTYKI